MKPIFFLLFLFSIALISDGISQTKSGVCNTFGVYDTDGIKPEEYRQRRSLLLSKMDSNSIAILRAQEYARRSGDEYYQFRQNSNFLYFTGCNESNSTLIIVPGGFKLDAGKTVKEILFIAPEMKNWTGESLGTEGAGEILGFGSEGTQSIALTNNRMKEILASLFLNARVLYYTPSLPEILIDPVSDISFDVWRESMNNLQDKYPNIEVRGIDTLLGGMRTIKSPAEIELLQKAVDATVAAHIEAMKSCEPNMFEYQLQAVAEYCFKNAGAEYPGFRSIIGSGLNSQSFHYDKNRRKMLMGDLVVIDIGAEYHGYSADVTRTIPVDGKFTPAQKEIYELVLNAQQAAINTIVPGVMLKDVKRKVLKIINDGLLRLGIAKNEEDGKKYFPHGIGHCIGLDVHDVDASGGLVAGMVIALEPGVYIPEGSDCDKKYWNIGIRIEDIILITDKECRVLSGFAPKSVQDIEALMKKKGIGNQQIGRE